jgi:DNA mismatch repair ATPase MutL
LGEDIFIVDQHASDEKFRFESFSKEFKIETQPLATPSKLDLPRQAIAIILDNPDVFHRNGFTFESREGDLFLVSVPSFPKYHFDVNGNSILLSYEELNRLVRLDVSGEFVCGRWLFNNCNNPQGSFYIGLKSMQKCDHDWRCTQPVKYEPHCSKYVLDGSAMELSTWVSLDSNSQT